MSILFDMQLARSNNLANRNLGADAVIVASRMLDSFINDELPANRMTKSIAKLYAICVSMCSAAAKNDAQVLEESLTLGNVLFEPMSELWLHVDSDDIPHEGVALTNIIYCGLQNQFSITGFLFLCNQCGKTFSEIRAEALPLFDGVKRF